MDITTEESGRKTRGSGVGRFKTDERGKCFFWITGEQYSKANFQMSYRCDGQ